MNQSCQAELEVGDGWFIAHVPELHAHIQAETWKGRLEQLR